MTLFVRSAVDRAAAGQSLDGVPKAVPEIFVDYLRLVNAGRPSEAGITEEDFVAAAQCLAEVSLGSEFVPGDFATRDAITALNTAGFTDKAAALLDRLIAGGVLERRQPGGIIVLRFSLDPAAEHLAAIRRIFALRPGGVASIQNHFTTLASVAGYPQRIDGYLTAFATCYRAYEADLRLPKVVFPWEQRRRRQRPRAALETSASGDPIAGQQC